MGPIGGAVDVRICSDACATGGGLAAVAFSAYPGNEIAVMLKGAADVALAISLVGTNGIFASRSLGAVDGGENPQSKTEAVHFRGMRS